MAEPSEELEEGNRGIRPRKGRSHMPVSLTQANSLVDAIFKLGTDEARLFYMALTRVDTKNAFSSEPYVISTKEFSEAYNIPLSAAYSRLKAAVERLLLTPITIYEDEGGDIRKNKFPFCSKLSYLLKDQAEVEIVFNEHLRPHLYNLKKNFTKVPFEYLAELDTPFTMRAYIWFKRDLLLDKYQTEDGVVITLGLQWMKERAGLLDAYKEFKDFKKRMIEPAIKRINEKTDITVKYTKVLTGKKVSALKFTITEKEPNVVPLTCSRPRLPHRPSVVRGTHAEGLWARNCISLLTSYRETIKPFGKCLSLADMRKLVSYYRLIGDTLNADKIQNDIDKRQTKKVA